MPKAQQQTTTTFMTDIYDQSHPEETQDMVKASLQALRTAIKNPCHLAHSDAFLLLFLRSEVFDVEKALKRYQKYATTRKELLEPSGRYTESLTFELTSSEQAVIDTGIIQVLPKPHGSMGRAVVVFRPSLLDPKLYVDNDDLCVSVWHVLHKAVLDNENAQKFGIVVLEDLSNYKLSQFKKSLFKRLVKVLQGVVPVRISCIHICHPPMILQALLPIVQPFLHERLKKRIKFHTNPGNELVSKYQFSEHDLPDGIVCK